MGHTVTESIYSSEGLTIPLRVVSYIRVAGRHAGVGEDPMGIHVYVEGGQRIPINRDEAPRFMTAWCRYRGELEEADLMDLSPDAPPQQAGVSKMELLVAAMVPTLVESFVKENKNTLGCCPDWKTGVVMDAVKFAEIIIEACKGR